MDWGDLYPTQRKGVRFLTAHRHGALFADIGTGKSVMSMTAFEYLRLAGDVRRALVVAPLAVAKFTWTTEYKRWKHLKHLRVSLVAGTPAQRKEALDTEADMHVVNFDVLAKLIAQYRDLPWDVLIIDELSKLKDRSTKRYRALVRHLQDFNYRWGLTGTPAPNHLLELWPQCFVLDRGLGARATPPYGLGPSWANFRRDYFVQTDRLGYTWEPRRGTGDFIQERLKPLVFRASAVDMLGQKEVEKRVEPVELSKAVSDKYREAVTNAQLELGGEVLDFASAAILTGKLLQITSGSLYDDDRDIIALHQTKYRFVEDFVEAMQGQPLLLVYQFKHELDEYLRRLPQAVHMTARSPQSLIDSWNRNEIEVAVTHSASIGHGVNLQLGGAHHLLFTSPTYSSEQHDQMVGRLHRQGQKNTVLVHYPVACLDDGSPTIDQTVLGVLDRKFTLQEGILNAFAGS